MERRELNAEALSGRQLAVAALVAGLSPAAFYAGRAMWFWVLVWSAVLVAAAVLVLWRMRKAQGELAWPIRVLYAGWAVVLASRVLSRAVERLEQTSGGSPGFWLLIIITVPLVWIGWGKAAPFFRMTEILWLVMAATLGLVFVLGIGRVERQYLTVNAPDWRTAALAVGEIAIPSLFVLPHIYNVSSASGSRGLAWLSALGAIGAAMCLLTAGVLGAGGNEVPQAFYVAAGLVGKSARSEGLLSVIWLLPDLVFAGLLCRTWGKKWWPALAAALSAGISLTAAPKYFSAEICIVGSLLLLMVTLLLPAGSGNFVVKKRQ